MTERVLQKGMFYNKLKTLFMSNSLKNAMSQTLGMIFVFSIQSKGDDFPYLVNFRAGQREELSVVIHKRRAHVQ